MFGRTLAVIVLVLSFTSLLVAGTPDVEECDLADAFIDGDPIVTEEIDISDTDIVDDVQVFVDITHTFRGDLTVDLDSPAGTRVRLHDENGGSADDVLLTWTDSGIENTATTNYTCDCDVQPSGPGAMSDFAEETSDGEWVLSVGDTFFPEDDGRLNEWCLGLFLSPPPMFRRGDADGNGTVSAIPDSVVILDFAFNQGEAPVCADTADVNDDGALVALQDVVFLLLWGFLDGDVPPDPGTVDCGADPTEDALECETEPDCA